MSKLVDLSTVKVIQQIENKEICGKDLSPNSRRQIVAILDKSYTQEETAHILDVSDRTIQRDIKAIKSKSAKLVKDLTVDRAGGELIRKANILYKFAVKVKDYKLAWQIELDLTEMLQSLGFIHKEPEEVKHSGSISIEDKRAELAERAGRLGFVGVGLGQN